MNERHDEHIALLQHAFQTIPQSLGVEPREAVPVGRPVVRGKDWDVGGVGEQVGSSRFGLGRGGEGVHRARVTGWS